MSSNPYDPYSSYDPYQKPTENYQQSGPGSYNSYQQDTYQQYTPPAPNPYPAYSQPPIYQQPIIQPIVQPVMVAVAPPTNGKATASMVLGLCTFVVWFLAGVPAVILGHMALKEINLSNGTQGGKGQAITGLVLGYISVAGLAICIFCYLLGGLATLTAPQ